VKAVLCSSIFQWAGRSATPCGHENGAKDDRHSIVVPGH
jgi:hypothetical protein